MLRLLRYTIDEVFYMLRTLIYRLLNWDFIFIQMLKIVWEKVIWEEIVIFKIDWIRYRNVIIVARKKISLAHIHITQICHKNLHSFFTEFSIELLLLLRKVVCTHLSRHKFWKRNAAAVKMSPFFVEKQFSTTSHNCRCREAYYVGISATYAL